MSLGLSDFTGLPQNAAANQNPQLDTGDLLRGYNFGSKEFARLQPDQQPYVHILSLFRNDPTDDSEFKFVERRPSFNRRYVYVVGHSTDGSNWTTNDATIGAGALDAGDTIHFRVATDYDWSGNIGPRVGKGGKRPGEAGTFPKFILPGQLLKIAIRTDGASAWQTATYNGTSLSFIQPNDYVLVEIVSVTANGNYADIQTVVRRGTASAVELVSFYDATHSMASSSAAHPNKFPQRIEDWALEAKRCYVSGNVWGQGTGVPETWADQPFAVGTGLTSIVKTAIEMDNTTMATVMKLEPNEYLRLYAEKLFEHQMDKASFIYWSYLHQETMANGKKKNFTQGTIDYILQYGNHFELDRSTMHRDDFQGQLAEFKAVSHVNPKTLMVFADTVTFNWLFQLGGYWKNNVEVSDNYRMDLTDLMVRGQVKLGAVTFTVFGTPIGNLKITHDPMLDGSPIAMFGLPVNNVRYRPLVGNGFNRDTTVYRGVRTIQNTGVDETVDLVQTEFGMAHTMPEQMVVWTKKLV